MSSKYHCNGTVDWVQCKGDQVPKYVNFTESNDYFYSSSGYCMCKYHEGHVLYKHPRPCEFYEPQNL